MEKKQNLLRIVIPLTLLVIGYIFMYGKINEPIKVDPSQLRVLSIDHYYEDALTIASEWEPDAYLVHILASFTLPDESEPLIIRYGFRSRVESGKWLNVTYNSADLSQPRVAEGEFSEGSNRPLTQEIIVATAPLDTLDAIRIAYENGGNDFANKHRGFNNDSFVELQQENEGLGTGNLVWVVTFTSENHTTMYVTLDAANGKITDVWRNDSN